MKRGKKINWQIGDIFAVELKNGKFCLGHVLDLQMPNVVRCAFYDEIIETVNVAFNFDELCKNVDVISTVATTREQLDFNVWKIIGSKNITISTKDFPNEKFRENNWVGSKIYDAAIVEDFLNAFYALVPWDDWADPFYLDKLLIAISKKPAKLIFLK